MNLRKFRKATVKKRQLLDKEKIAKRRRKMTHSTSFSASEEQQQIPGNGVGEIFQNPSSTASTSIITDEESVHNSNSPMTMTTEDKSELSETSNTMTLEQFTDIVLASEGMTVNNNNIEVEESAKEKEEWEKKAMVATILQNKDLTVEVKTAKSKPVVLSPRDKAGFNNHNNHSVVVSVKPRALNSSNHHSTKYSSQNLVEEWLQKIPAIPHSNATPPETDVVRNSSALNLSVNNGSRNSPVLSTTQYSSSRGAFSTTSQNTPKSGAISQLDANKSRAIRDIQLAHTKDMHGN